MLGVELWSLEFGGELKIEMKLGANEFDHLNKVSFK